MYNLVMKDMLIQKKTFLISAFYGLFAVVALTNSFTAKGAYIFGSVSIVYLFVLYANSYDDKNKCDVLLNSLPISRRDIVLAKYLSLTAFAVLGIFITGFWGLAIKTLGLKIAVQTMTMEDIATIITILGAMYSIYYPLLFKFGVMRMRMFNMFLYLFFIFFPNILISYMKDNEHSMFIQGFLSVLQNQPSWMLNLLGMFLIILFIMISINISIGVYQQRDL